MGCDKLYKTLCSSETVGKFSIKMALYIVIILNTCMYMLNTFKSSLINFRSLSYEPRHEKTNVLVSDLVPHKPGCTATVDG